MKTKESGLVCHETNPTTVVIYHSLHNQPQQIEFENEYDKQEFVLAVNQGFAETGFPSIDAITLLTDEEARLSNLLKKRNYLSKTEQRLNFLSLMTAENCNLGCSYCIAAMNMDEAKKNKSLLMPWHIAKKGLDWYFSLPTIANEYYVNFSGGEPLINKNVVVQAVEYIRALKKDKPIRITINTNATLIDENLASFFAANRVEIASSLDGAPEASDMVRVTKKGLPASESIVSGWHRLIAAGCEITGFMATFNDKNLKYLDPSIIDFALEMNFSWVRIAPDVIHLLDYPIEDIIERIWAVYKYGTEKGVKVEGFWSTPIHNMLFKERIPDGVGFFCGAVSGETASVHPDGRISACGFSSGNFGNILNDIPFDWNKHKNFVSEYFPGSRDFCEGCSIEGSCAGGCNITREVAISTTDESAILYNCNMYRELTKRLLIDHFTGNPLDFKDDGSSHNIGY